MSEHHQTKCATHIPAKLFFSAQCETFPQRKSEQGGKGQTNLPEEKNRLRSVQSEHFIISSLILGYGCLSSGTKENKQLSGRVETTFNDQCK